MISPSSLQVGQTASFIITVTNTGIACTTNLPVTTTVTDTVPSSFSDPSGTGLGWGTSGTGCPAPSPATPLTVTCTTTSYFNPGQPQTATITITATAVGPPGNYTNCADFSNTATTPPMTGQTTPCARVTVTPAPVVQGSCIDLSTGTNGDFTADAHGAVDSLWTVTDSYGTAVLDYSVGPFTGWDGSPTRPDANVGVSVNWVSPYISNAGYPDANTPQGAFTYARTFTVPAGPASILTVYELAADNSAYLFLDGNIILVANTPADHAWANPAGPITVTFPASTTATTHTLTASVHNLNDAGFTGLMVRATVCQQVSPACDLSITKTMSPPSPVLSGSTVTFTFTVEDVGALPCAGSPTVPTPPTTVADIFPAGVTAFQPVNAPPGWLCYMPPDGSSISCTTPGGIQVNQPITITVQATMSAIAGNIANCATVSNTLDLSPPNNPANNESCVAISVSQSPVCDMAIDKEITPNAVTVFQLVTVTLTVKNAGNGDCNDASNSAPVTVEDTIAPGLSFLSSYGIIQTPSGWWSCSPAVSCTSTHVFAPGDSSTLSFQFSASTDGTYTNCATVSDLNDISPPNDVLNNESCVKFAVSPLGIVTVVAPACNLAINKTISPSTVTAGQPLTVTLTVKNVGNGDCNDASNNAPISVNDPLASGWTFSTSYGLIQNPSGWWVCSAAVSCTSSHVFAPTDTSTLIFQFTVPAAGNYTNCATVSSSNDYLPNNQANNKSCAPFTVVGACDWAITKTMTPTVIPQNQQASVTITITNLGSDCAPPSRWQDNLPASITANPPISSADWLCGGHGPPNAEVWCNSGSPYTATGSLPHGYTKMFNLNNVIAVGAPGDYTNCATVTNQNDISPPNNPVNNKSCVPFTITPPVPGCDLALNKTMTPAQNQQATVTLTVKNLGGPCNPVNHVEDDLPPSLTVVSPPASSAYWACGSHTTPIAAVWCDSTGSLPAGYTTTFTFTVAVSGCGNCAFILKWGTTGSGKTNFNNPSGIAVDASGNVYVVDTGNNRVQKFDGSGNYLMTFGQGQLSQPDAVAVDAAGKVYVAEKGPNPNRVSKFDGSGSLILTWNTAGGQYSGFGDTIGVAVDPTTGDIYVAGTGGEVEKFSNGGAFKSQYGFGALGGINGIAVDSSGYVYVTINNVYKFSGAATTSSPPLTIQSTGSALASPFGVAVDSAGNVYATGWASANVEKFSGSGATLLTWGSPGSGDGQFAHCVGNCGYDGPQGVAVDPNTGNVYVVDTGNNRVEEFGDLNCAFVRSTASSGGNNDVDQTNNQVCIFLNGAPLQTPHCIIATAAYGSELAPPVQFLRNFRDNQVQKTNIGANFMTAFNNWYYSWAPGIAQQIAPNENYKAVTRVIIAPLIGSLYVGNMAFVALTPASPELAILSAGLLTSAILGLIYLSPVYALAWRLSKRKITQRTIYSLAAIAAALTLLATLTTGTFNAAANLTALAVVESMLLSPAIILQKITSAAKNSTPA
jgi:uncharacterized repeat protein (TIGR01451 family)